MCQAVDTCVAQGAVQRLISWVRSEMKGFKKGFTTITINKLEMGECIPVHVDRFNWDNSTNYVLAVGAFQGGWTWMCVAGGSRRPPEECCVEDAHADLKGVTCDPRAWLRLQPHTPHAVAKVSKGVRWSIAVSTMGQLHKVAEGLWDSLGQLGFPIGHIKQEASKLHSGAGNDIMFRPWKDYPSMR
eukprot:2419242-Amphidinium_carterae.1